MITVGEIIWLVSYPRSGNTWLRAFLTSFLRDTSQGTLLTDLQGIYASSRSFFDYYAGVEASLLTKDEITRLRPLTYSAYAQSSDGPVLLKLHDHYRTIDGDSVIRKCDSKGIVYLIRNPLDVAISFARHLGMPVEQAISDMSNAGYRLSDYQHGITTQLPQLLSTWSKHVEGWVDNGEIPIQVLRYEDMLARPDQTFKSLLEFLGWDYDDQRLEQAIENSSFTRLKALEQDTGFAERPLGSKAFFRSGQAGGWRAELTAAQTNRMIADHAAVMRRFGYLNEQGEVVP